MSAAVQCRFRPRRGPSFVRMVEVPYPEHVELVGYGRFRKTWREPSGAPVYVEEPSK